MFNLKNTCPIASAYRTITVLFLHEYPPIEIKTFMYKCMYIHDVCTVFELCMILEGLLLIEWDSNKGDC